MQFNGQLTFTLVAGVQLGDVKCEVCEMILNYLDEALKENKTVQAVEALLDRVCDILPTTFKEEVMVQCCDFHSFNLIECYVNLDTLSASFVNQLYYCK